MGLIAPPNPFKKLIDRIASDEVLEAAYQWLCEKRTHYHFNGDVWQIRRWWTEKKADVQKLLLAGQYRFRELRLIRGEDYEKFLNIWR